MIKRTVITFLCILALVSAHAADITPITNAFKGGKAVSLSSYFDQEVDVAVPGTSKKCNGDEATKILTDFFSKNKPNTFTVVHHADKKENGFLVGKLPTPSGEYRVNITYKTDGNKLIIQSIRIE